MRKSKTKSPQILPIELQAYEPGEMWSTYVLTIGKTNYLVTVDKVSRFLMLETLPNKTSKAVSSKLKRWATIMGIPCIMPSDGGPAFSANPFTAFCPDLG